MGFHISSHKLYEELKKEIIPLEKNKGILFTQIDYCGHSMGGILARYMAEFDDYFNKSNYNEGLINKLITIGTPHQGSFLASFANQFQQNLNPNLNLFISSAFPNIPIFLKSISDLSYKSNAFKFLNSNDIPSHAIVCNANVSEFIDEVSMVLGNLKDKWDAKYQLVAFYAKLFELSIMAPKEIVESLLEQKLEDFIEKITGIKAAKEWIKNTIRDMLKNSAADMIYYIHGQNSDIIVDTESQEGSISRPQISYFENITHIQLPGLYHINRLRGETNSKVIANRVIELLGIPETDDVFRNGFPNPNKLTRSLPAWLKPQNIKPASSKAISFSNKLTAEIKNQNNVFNLIAEPNIAVPSQTINLSIETKSIDDISYVIFFYFDTMLKVSNQPFSCDITIPSNYKMEESHFGAWIVTNNENVFPAKTSIEIDHEKDRKLDSIRVLGAHNINGENIMEINNSFDEIPIVVIASYDDDFERVLSSNYTINISNEDIATLNDKNNIIIYNNGTTNVEVKYKDLKYVYTLIIKENDEVNVMKWSKY